MSVLRAERIADAVLYEGYVLYPYRASAVKNQVRWPFGVIAPRVWAERDGSERWRAQTTCLVTPGISPAFDLRLRWLRVQHRRLETAADGGAFVPVDRLHANGEDLMPWDEGVLASVDLHRLELETLLAGPHVHDIALEPVQTVERVPAAGGSVRGRVIRTCDRLLASIIVTADACGPLARIGVRIENTTPIEPDASRDTAMGHALAAAHVILSVTGGAFVSLLDPPAAARDAAAACVNDGLWPVLVGPAPAADVLLASPIILYDYPAVAPESPGDLCDGTEIDEILTLRILTLTDAEKQEARATDARARQIIDRTDALPPAALERLHGAVRSWHDGDQDPAGTDPFAPLALPAGEAPGEASLAIAGARIMRGSQVILRPQRRADPMDMFFDGRRATVAGVYPDVDGRTHVAVTVDNDPARELYDESGRYFYFSPDEVVPVEPSAHPPAPDAPEAEVTRCVDGNLPQR